MGSSDYKLYFDFSSGVETVCMPGKVHTNASGALHHIVPGRYADEKCLMIMTTEFF